MRCLVLIAFCISAALAVELSSSRLSARVKAPNVQLHLGPREFFRAKRDVRVHPMEDPDDCIQNCTYKMHEGLQSLNDSDPEDVRMVALCKSLEPVESCYKTCPESQFRSLMTDFLPLMKQPCLLGNDQYPELKKSLDCLNSTVDAVAEKCDAVCNGSFAGDIRLDSRILLNVDPTFVMYDDDKIENRDVLKSTCSFITCVQQCGDPIVKAKCGQKTVDVDHKMDSSIFGTISKLYMDLQALDGEVKECKALM